MKNLHVAYTLAAKAVNGKEMSFEKERILFEQDTLDPQTIQDIIEEEFRKTEKVTFVTALQSELNAEISEIIVKVTKVTELQSAGDDDQM